MNTKQNNTKKVALILKVKDKILSQTHTMLDNVYRMVCIKLKRIIFIEMITWMITP